MAGYEFQKILLTLYTNKKFQERFFSHQEEVLSCVSLTDRERNTLMRVSQKEVEIFSRELFHKRREFMESTLRKRGEMWAAVSSFYESCPVIMYMGEMGQQVIEINEGGFSILEHMERPLLTMRHLMDGYMRSASAKARDLFLLVRAVARNGIWGRMIKII